MASLTGWELLILQVALWTAFAINMGCLIYSWRAARRWSRLNILLTNVWLSTWQIRRDGWPVDSIWREQLKPPSKHLPRRGE